MLKTFRAKMGVCLTMALSILTVLAFATGDSASMSSITTATVTQLTTVQQAMLNLISQILPVALVVMGSILVVTLGIRLFKRFAA